MKDEQKAFEAWAQSLGLNMDKHPLHYLFLDLRTAAARAAWKAALSYAKRGGVPQEAA